MTGVPRIAPKGLERISLLRKLARTYGVDVSENVVSDLVRQRRLRVQHFVGPGQRTFHYYDPAKDQEHNLRVIMTEGRRILNASKRISAQKEAAAKEKKAIAKAGERKPALRPKRTPV
ncbi:MAG: hypothetical protein Q7R47_00225, partial [Candidatus Diapherotrites archaeon]|nr:hypothetical protein [Candidatus Diapherotrites archaeon]